MRELVSKKNIDKIVPIEGADKIEALQIGGWKSIAQKGEFKEGDKVVFIEIDSHLPQWECFDFLKDRCLKFDGYYIKTIRLRGIYSQGLVIKESELTYSFKELKEQTQHIDDVRAKFQKNNVQGNPKGSFPSWIIKTDETRIQNMNPPFIDLDKPLFITEKIDGTSATYYIDIHTNEFGFASRNQKLDPAQDPPTIYGEMAQKYNIEAVLRKMKESTDEPIWIQGEIVGPGVQGNHYELSERKLFVFNASHPELLPTEILTVPRLQNPTDFEGCDTYEYWLNLADIKSTLNPKKIAEGIVIRQGNSQFDREPSFKVINNKYLVK